MADEHRAGQTAVPAAAPRAQKPQYAAPAIVDLTSSTRGAAGTCWGGSGDIGECREGYSAAYDCLAGYGY